MNKADFARYVDIAMQGDGLGFMRPVVEKELLHYEIFTALDEDGLLKHLVFQGGTSLRLCYGSNRFSEDLDFAGGRTFSARDMGAVKDCIANRIGNRFDLDVTVKEPKESPHGKKVQVAKWTVAIQTSPGRPDIPMQKINLEIANVPAYSRELMPLRINYPVLVGRSQTLIAVESKNEILADKLIALPASITRWNGSTLEETPSRVRHRDLWDIAWLTRNGAQMEMDQVKAKINDYGLQHYPEMLERAILEIPKITQGATFRDQMMRFLPKDQHERVFGKPGYAVYFQNSVTDLLNQVARGLEKSGPDWDFEL